MLHKNVIEAKGFKILDAAELKAVSGGEIVVIGGDGGGGMDPSVTYELMGGTLGAALASMQLAQYGMTGEAPPPDDEILVVGERDDYNAYNWVGPWLLPDSDLEDFIEYLMNDTDTTEQELANMIIVEATLGDKELIIAFNGYGEGAIYIVHDNVFTDDEFTLFSLISNVQVSAGQSESAGISGTSGVLNIGSDASISFTLDGPNG